MTQEPTAIASHAGEGQIVEAFGTNILRITSPQTRGATSVIEIIFPAGAETPLHVHQREDEMFRVLSGRFGFWCGENYDELDEGGIIFLPRNIAHRVKNVSTSDGRVMVILTPGGFEEFFVRVAAGGDPHATASDFGLKFL
ncbi:cupin domain-containing protein [Ochrobactrum soli]|uniref:cupin domain-containing protein n=1 Tax=Ochrobactrum soli TaxID=2448455 RepID=UPI000D690FBC|nr:cupin domain-containing protein [[Ochrobactrum] soli]